MLTLHKLVHQKSLMHKPQIPPSWMVWNEFVLYKNSYQKTKIFDNIFLYALLKRCFFAFLLGKMLLKIYTEFCISNEVLQSQWTQVAQNDWDNLG